MKLEHVKEVLTRMSDMSTTAAPIASSHRNALPLQQPAISLAAFVTRTSLVDMRVATKAAATTMETTILTVVEAFVILELNLVLYGTCKDLVYGCNECKRL
jgi:hypothetical protein